MKESYNSIDQTVKIDLKFAVKAIVALRLPKEIRSRMLCSLLQEYPAPEMIDVLIELLCQYQECYEQRMMPGTIHNRE